MGRYSRRKNKKQRHAKAEDLHRNRRKLSLMDRRKNWEERLESNHGRTRMPSKGIWTLSLRKWEQDFYTEETKST